MLEVLKRDREEQPERKICPIRALAYTLAPPSPSPLATLGPYCIGERCAWAIPVDEGLVECAVKRLNWP